MSQAVDRNLLLGLLALQMNLISREAFLAAMRVWVSEKSRSLGEILLAQGALVEAERALLEIAVERQIKSKPGAADESLAALRTATTLHFEIENLSDPEVNATLARLSSGRGTVTGDTLPFFSGAASDRAGRFRLLRELARGGLGKVQLALDEELQREVALKEIQTRFAGDLALRRRFVLEAEITGRLEHPGVVPVYGMGAYPDGRPYYAMRFIKGESLREAIAKFHAADGEPSRDPGERALSLRKLLASFVGVCNAIEYAHSRGVLHRDLKPDNIMLGAYGETLVVDWGLAKLVERGAAQKSTGEETLELTAAADPAQTQMGQAIGTPAYMSPEQGQGRHSTLTPASDVYSLGATLYSLLTGKQAFVSAHLDDVLQLVQAGDFPNPRQMNPRVPPALAAVCVKAMARLPGDRYASARDLADEIETWLADEPVRAWTEPWRERTGRWLRRHRSVVAGAAAAAAATLIGLAALVLVLSFFNQRLDKERKRAEENFVLARDANEGLEAQRKRAEGNFKLAREAVDVYLVQVSEDPRLRRQGLETLRRELLETAREFYEKLTAISTVEGNSLAGPADGSLHLRGEQARAYFRLAGITAEIGGEEKGAEYFGKVIDILKKVTAEEPDSFVYQDLYVAALNNLGLSQNRLGRFDEAIATYTAAAERGEELIKQHGNEATYQSNLAATRAKLGGLYQATNRPDLAEVELRRAANTFELLIRAHPQEVWYRSELALARHNLGLLYLGSGHTEKAEASFEASLILFRDCVREEPDDLGVRANLGLCLASRGSLFWTTGRHAEAEVSYRESIALREPLLALHPDVARNQSELALAQANLGMIYTSSDRAELAEKLLTSAVQLLEDVLAKNPQAHNTLDQLARTKQNLGNVYERLNRLDETRATREEMLALRERLAKEHPDVAAYQLLLAQVLMSRGLDESNRQQYEEAAASFDRALGLAGDLLERLPLVLEHQELVGQLKQGIGALHTKTREFDLAAQSLAAAKKIQQPLVRDHAERPQLRYQLSQTHLSLARLHEAKEEFEPAEAAYRAASELLFALVREFPSMHDYRGALIKAQQGLVFLYQREERLLEAESEMNRLVDLARDLATKHPDTPALIDELGAAQHNLGLLYLSLKRTTEAAALFQAAIDTRTTLVVLNPQVRQYKFHWSQDLIMLGWLDYEGGRYTESAGNFERARRALGEIIELERMASDETRGLLGQVEHNRGLLFVRQDKLNDAAVAFRASAEHREAGFKNHPGEAAYATDWAWSCQNLAQVFSRQKEPEEALIWVAKAKTAIESLSPEARSAPSVWEPLRAAYGLAGKLLGEEGKLEESLVEWNRAVDLDPESGIPALRLGRAEALFRLGKYTEALADARRVKGPLATNWSELFALTKSFLDCRAAILKDQKLTVPERADYAKQFEGLALEYLQFGDKAGYFTNAANLEQLKTDKAFDPLRERTEFKALLEMK